MNIQHKSLLIVFAILICISAITFFYLKTTVVKPTNLTITIHKFNFAYDLALYWSQKKKSQEPNPKDTLIMHWDYVKGHSYQLRYMKSNENEWFLSDWQNSEGLIWTIKCTMLFESSYIVQIRSNNGWFNSEWIYL